MYRHPLLYQLSNPCGELTIEEEADGISFKKMMISSLLSCLASIAQRISQIKVQISHKERVSLDHDQTEAQISYNGLPLISCFSAAGTLPARAMPPVDGSFFTAFTGTLKVINVKGEVRGQSQINKSIRLASGLSAMDKGQSSHQIWCEWSSGSFPLLKGGSIIVRVTTAGRWLLFYGFNSHLISHKCRRSLRRGPKMIRIIIQIKVIN